MDLTGLTPEQINDISKTNINSNLLLIQAANALSEDRLRRARGEQVPIQVGDITQSVLREDLPTAMNYAAQNRTENFILPGGAKIRIPLDKQPQMLEYLRKNAKTPYEIAAMQALEDRQRAMAGEARARTEKIGLESDQLSQQQMAIQALKGTGMSDWTDATNATNAATAFPGVAAALANKANLTGAASLTPNIERQYLDSMKELSVHMKFNPKKVTDDLINNYNQMAATVKGTSMWYRNSEGDATQITLPAVGGVQMTPEKIIKYAAKTNQSVNDVLNQIQAKITKVGE